MKKTHTILLTAAVTLLFVAMIGATHTTQSEVSRFQLVIGPVCINGSNATGTCWRINTVTGDTWIWTPQTGFTLQRTSQPQKTNRLKGLPEKPRLIPD